MTEQPKPCPFCGHVAVIEDVTTSYRKGVDPLWSVGCDNQHCPVEAHAHIVAPDASAAIIAWNTRHDPNQAWLDARDAEFDDRWNARMEP